MLVECPRCHFRQPQDQYCANCGVDMLAYKPKEVPLLTRIAKSGMFQFLMVVVLGIAVTYFVVRTDQPQQWIQKINRFASVAPNPKAKTEAGIAEDQQDFEAPPAAANAWATRSASATESAAMMAEGGTATAAGAPPSSVNAATAVASRTAIVSGTTKLVVRMVEIDHDYLDNLTTEKNGKTTPISGNINTFRSYPDLALDAAYYKVLKTEVLEMNKDKKNSTLIAGNAARGFRINFQEIDDFSGDTHRILDASFNKIHPNDNQQFQIELFIYATETNIISGSDMISYFDVENDLAGVAPFTIFKSADYRNQKTTFAIIIELQ